MQQETSLQNGNVESVWGQRPSWLRTHSVVLAFAALFCTISTPPPSRAQGTAADTSPIKERHAGAQRARATQLPRSESDQALVEGWPLYRTERGQTAFNDAMATLKATDGAAPAAAAFKGCAVLECNLALPALAADGWIPTGRLWVSATDYVLIVHSPRPRAGMSTRRRPFRAMRYFVFYEFHNSSRNTDLYDTISSHSGPVFVPFYMSKPSTDANGRRFVIVVQVAPYDVVSIHASNRGSAGPGIEVARNVSDAIEPLQNLAGILVASIVKTAAPHLQIVNHRGAEGQPMLSAYERRLAALPARPGTAAVTVPFVAAPTQRLAAVTGKFDDLILRRGASPRIPLAERGIIPGAVRSAAATATPTSRRIAATQQPVSDVPMLVEPIQLATPPLCSTRREGANPVACRQRLGTQQ